MGDGQTMKLVGNIDRHSLLILPILFRGEWSGSDANSWPMNWSSFWRQHCDIGLILFHTTPVRQSTQPLSFWGGAAFLKGFFCYGWTPNPEVPFIDRYYESMLFIWREAGQLVNIIVWAYFKSSLSKKKRHYLIDRYWLGNRSTHLL